MLSIYYYKALSAYFKVNMAINQLTITVTINKNLGECVLESRTTRQCFGTFSSFLITTFTIRFTSLFDNYILRRSFEKHL